LLPLFEKEYIQRLALFSTLQFALPHLLRHHFTRALKGRPWSHKERPKKTTKNQNYLLM
jgi:hypothetical protein